MTAEEVYESVTNGGASDFAVAVEIFDRFGRWRLAEAHPKLFPSRPPEIVRQLKPEA